MTRRRTIVVVCALLLLVIGLVLWRGREEVVLVPEHDRTVGGETRGEASWLTSEVAGTTDPPCSATLQRLDALIATIHSSCSHFFALEGHCPPPLPFPATENAAEQFERLSSDLTGCDLAGVAVDCSEFPCIALFDRSTLERGDYNCEALTAKFSAASPPSRADVAQDTPGWESWVPMALMLSSDPMLHSRMIGRWPARSTQLLPRLPAMSDTAVSDSPGSEACTWAADSVKTLEEGLMGDPCSTLQAHLGCAADSAVDDDEYAQHVSFGEAVVTRLREECGDRIDSSVLLDCSSVPCLLAMPAAFRDHDSPHYCAPTSEFQATMGMAAEPDVTVAVLYRSTKRKAEAHIEQRHLAEREARVADVLWRYGTISD